MCGILALIMKSATRKYSERFMMNQLHKINWRGPDANAALYPADNVWFGFNRLSINDLTPSGMQPMQVGPATIVVNCEIYNFPELQRKYNFDMKSTCDTEIILHLYLKFGIEKTVKMLDGVFSFVIHDSRTGQIWAARDPYGVRPSFIGKDDVGNIAICSEAKGLDEFCSQIQQFPPGHFWNLEKDTFTRYHTLVNNEKTMAEMGPEFDKETALEQVKQNFIDGVEKRLLSDREIGCFLSGGLDSSLVAGLVAQRRNPYSLNTFSIGMDRNAPDLKYAQKVAEHCKTTHHHVEFGFDDAMEAINDLIFTLESYDVTTIRASLGMYLLSKHVKQKTDVTVLFSGEGADEVCQGYLYFHKQPNAIEGSRESHRLVNDLYMYDVLRCDRTTSGWGLEVREPFLDKKFVQSYFDLPVDLKAPVNNLEKHTLRSLFKEDDLIPDEVLWRIKEAFSDGMATQKKTLHLQIQEYIEGLITDTEFETERKLYKVQPISKEALYYRRIYDKYFGRWDFIPYYWQPKWTGKSNPDPSAREQNFYRHSEQSKDELKGIYGQ